MSDIVNESLEVNVSVSEPEMIVELSDNREIVSLDDGIKEEVKEELKEEVKEEQKDVMVEIINLTLQNMFENFLQKNEAELKEVNVKLSPELQKYFLIFCQENPAFFTDVENSLKIIIMDNSINSKDIPELLNLMSKIYIILKDKKKRSEYLDGVDPYAIIESLLRIVVTVYVEKQNKDYNKESINLLVEQVMNIVKIAIELMKLPIIEVLPKKGCLRCLFGK